MGRVLGLVAPLMLSLAASPSWGAIGVSPVTDTRAPRAHQALVWQRALLPGADAAWSLPNRRPARAFSPSASAKLQYVRSNPHRSGDYLRPRECAVESNVTTGPDPSTLAVLALLPARLGGEPTVSKVAQTVPPLQHDPSPADAASAAVAASPVVAANPVVATSLVVATSPVVAVSPIVVPSPAVEASPTVAANPESAPASVADASSVPAPELSIGRLDIKELDRELAERFVRLKLTSAAALVVDQQEGNLLFAKNPDAVRSIASITKLMTAMVALDAGLPLDERLTVQAADVRIAKGKQSRLKVGVSLTRREMFKLALMSSENRAAAALARTYPGGLPAFVEAMNRKADSLGMVDSRFVEPTGLDSNNVSTAHDLALMVNAAYAYALIRESTTSDLHEVPAPGRRNHRAVMYHNSNRLVRDSEWDVGLSKTGYIGKAGRCLAMQATIAAKPVIIVLLDSLGKVARVADANRIKRWLEGPDVTVAGAVRNKPRM